jgi:hypothetical protein
MTGSDKPKSASNSAERLTKASPKGSVELSEAALGEASGGAVFPSSPAISLKLDSSLKLEQKGGLDANLLLPAVKPIG